MGYKQRMNTSRLISLPLAGLITLGTLGGTATVAQADTASTAAIAIGAAAIVGALLTDNSGRSYYVNGNQRHYVSHDTATYYRSHHGNGNHGYSGNGNNQGYGNNHGYGGNQGYGNNQGGNNGHDDHNHH